MRKPEIHVLTALCNLENNPDFRIVREWFLESAGDQDDVLRSAESAHVMYRAQGAVKELLEFGYYAASPRELAGKLAAKKAGIHSIP
jgi:hypothetical protein